MKVIIVEDEAIASRQLQRMLETKGIQIMRLMTSVEELREQLIDPSQPDLYFFDIHLNDGIVFEALEDIEVTQPIIFTTAYDQYAIKAFKQNSIDYLLKPIDGVELDAAIEKYNSMQKYNIDISSLTALLNQNRPNQTVSYRERISVRVGDKIKTIPMKQILFFYLSLIHI